MKIDKKLSKIKRVIELVYLSSFLIDEKPLSLLCIAPPEQSKTYSILSYKTKYSSICTDLSFMGIINILQRNKNLKHIIIPDLLKVTQKKQATKDNTLTMINSFLEEGVFEITLGNKEVIDFKGRNGGLITSTTLYSYHQNKDKWKGIGFLSRFIVLSWQYSQETLNEVLDLINQETNSKNIKPKNLNIKKVKVKSDYKINKQLNKYCENSIRKLKNLQILLKCIALSHKRDYVIEKDLFELKELIDFMNFKFKPI